MQIVTDYAADIFPEQLDGFEIHYVPMRITIDGKTYRSGIDITSGEFYELQAKAKEIPTTSQPSPGDFVELYRKIAKDDPDILSIHMSSGLSGTVNSARIAAKSVPEANIEIYDSKGISGAVGWHIEVAAKAVRAGFDKARILSLLKQVTEATETFFMLSTLKYVIPGGRLSGIKKLLASVLNIKPVSQVEKENGTCVIRQQARSINRAIDGIADLLASAYPAETLMRMQIFHSQFPEGAARLKEQLDKIFRCNWLPQGQISPVLGAHSGPGLVGIVAAPEALLPKV